MKNKKIYYTLFLFILFFTRFTLKCQVVPGSTGQEGQILKAANSSVSANDDLAVINEDDSVSINVLNNDFGLTDGIKSLTIVTDPAHGKAKVNEDYSVTYIPDRSYFGDDSFTYEVCNNSGSCATANVIIEIKNVDFTPVAVNDSVTYIHGSNISVPVLNNDSVKGDYPITVSIVSDLNNGNSYIDENNLLIPSFNRSFIGTDSLVYSVCDADNDCSTAKVIFYVEAEEGSEFYIPNGFSPNGDGINDTFYIPDFSTYTNINARIINEIGQIVFQENPYQNNWNGVANTGRLKGQPVPSGTYYYIFSIEGIKDPLSGYVYLSR